VFDVDWIGQLGREVLRERTGALIAEACAWAVGLSDQPHRHRRAGVVRPSGLTVGERAATGLPLADDEDGRLDLGDARPGSFQDALNSVGASGALNADRFDDEVLVPFVLDTCLQAAERARRTRPVAWAELAEDVGEDADDLPAVVRAGDWEAPLRIDAEHLVLAALGAVPLMEVEAEGLPLSLVRAAEQMARSAVRTIDEPADDAGLAGALFVAEAAVRTAGLALPVPPERARDLLDELLAGGLEPAEVTVVLPHLPVQEETAHRVLTMLESERPAG
jgi:hypothetical protein